MNINVLFLSLMMTIPFCAKGQSDGNIIVHIENIDREEGTLRVGLFTENDKFLKEASYSQDIPVEGRNKISLTFENIPYGTYAISVYQDLDDNGELDTNFIGIPREPVGFSNDHRPKMSPPKFKAAGFVLDQPSYSETIAMYTYWITGHFLRSGKIPVSRMLNAKGQFSAINISLQVTLVNEKTSFPDGQIPHTGNSEMNQAMI